MKFRLLTVSVGIYRRLSQQLKLGKIFNLPWTKNIERPISIARKSLKSATESHSGYL